MCVLFTLSPAIEELGGAQLVGITILKSSDKNVVFGGAPPFEGASGDYPSKRSA